jgi:hypothetical protein
MDDRSAPVPAAVGIAELGPWTPCSKRGARLLEQRVAPQRRPVAEKASTKASCTLK